ncbi:hypothetical protein [Halomicrococcus gelatinilyticus]|uniref:hypothetical protein n=1 Tax=Halomicrococcus gelatinilyticus TaxID=1702103 RepID=UPI002E117CCB
MTGSERDDAEEAVRDWGEEVRRRELSRALRRLEASGEVTAEERALVAVTSRRVVAALIERWLANCRSDAAVAVLADVVTD